MRYAQGRRAFGFCDRCQFRADLNDLRYEIVAGKKSGLRMCAECLDDDHPQLLLGRMKIYDPVTLRDPRPPQDYELPLPSGPAVPATALLSEGALPLQTEDGQPITT